jgi:hypothetical protein
VQPAPPSPNLIARQLGRMCVGSEPEPAEPDAKDPTQWDLFMIPEGVEEEEVEEEAGKSRHAKPADVHGRHASAKRLELSHAGGCDVRAICWV